MSAAKEQEATLITYPTVNELPGDTMGNATAKKRYKRTECIRLRNEPVSTSLSPNNTS
jgi:hypothetical protein